jgi:hypothetical protein
MIAKVVCSSLGSYPAHVAPDVHLLTLITAPTVEICRDLTNYMPMVLSNCFSMVWLVSNHAILF